jgi:hypothetical protein
MRIAHICENTKAHTMAWKHVPPTALEHPTYSHLTEKYKPDPTGKVVRGLNYVGGVKVIPVEGKEGRCRVLYIVHSDIKGTVSKNILACRFLKMTLWLFIFPQPLLFFFFGLEN